MPALDPAAPVAELTQALVDIPSVSGDEAAIADAVEAVLRSAPHLEVLRDGDAVVARTNLGRDRRAVIAGHLDTVPINRNLPSWIEDGDLVGRGTVDMKGGCAIALKLAVELVEPVVDVTWVFYDHEEVSSDLNGLGRLARTRPELLAADFAILGEPSSGEVEAAATAPSGPTSSCAGAGRTRRARGWAPMRSRLPRPC